MSTRLYRHVLQRVLLGGMALGLGAFGSPEAGAQAPDDPRSTSVPLRVSLAEALQRAARVNEEGDLARADADSARAQQVRARSGFFPQVTLSASYERTLASEFDDAFDAPATGMGEAGLDLGDLPFGRRNAYRASASISQNVFAGGRTLASTKAAAASARQAAIGVRSAEAEVQLATVEAYYDAALSDRFVEIAERSLEQAKSTVDQVRASRKEGQQSEFELLRAQVELEGQRPTWVARRRQRDLAYLRLRQRLGLPRDQALILTSRLDAAGVAGPPPPASLDPAPAPEERAPVRQASHAMDAAASQVEVARAGYYPSLNLAMTYGRVSYPDGIAPELDDLRTNWTVGAYLSWAIFEGLATRGQVLSAEADLARARARYVQIAKLAELETAGARMELEGAHAVLEASTSTVERATRAYAIAEIRYREGISTQLELADARLLLARAETDRARAARDLEVARARLELLPDLPLSGLSPAGPLPSSMDAAAASPAQSPTPASPAQPTSTQGAGAAAPRF